MLDYLPVKINLNPWEVMKSTRKTLDCLLNFREIASEKYYIPETQLTSKNDYSQRSFI